MQRAVEQILWKRRNLRPDRALLVGISGIDASGKGWLTSRLAASLAGVGRKTVTINGDGWLELPERRFDAERPAEHFYQHAFRFEDMFGGVVLPLRDRRSCDVVADFADETASRFRPHRYRFDDVDVILLEGIYLFKRRYRGHFDLACWVDCTFETSLERALRRGQEGLPPEQVVRAYETIYFPAQRIHFERDEPRSGADLVLGNDPRLVR